MLEFILALHLGEEEAKNFFDEIRSETQPDRTI
jgi:hypothetical protein